MPKYSHQMSKPREEDGVNMGLGNQFYSCRGMLLTALNSAWKTSTN